MDWAKENVVTRNQLLEENRQFKLQALTYQEQLMQLEILQQGKRTD